MKNSISVLFCFCLTVLHAQERRTVSADGKCGSDQWELAFEENFDGNTINTAIWENRGHAQGSSLVEGSEEYFTFDNVKVEDGVCKLIAKKETVVRKCVSWKPDSAILEDGMINIRTYRYTAAHIETKIKNYHYGKYEIRCKIPRGKALWPAFWMYGEKDRVNHEIDVFEFWNPTNVFGKYQPRKLSMEHQMTLHYDRKMSGKSYTGPDYSLDYHVFSVVWDSTKIEWFVDGVSKRVATRYVTKRGKNVNCDEIKAGKTYYLNPVFPDHPMAIIADIAIQDGKNAPDEHTFDNPVFLIDYIRYYKPR